MIKLKHNTLNQLLNYLINELKNPKLQINPTTN